MKPKIKKSPERAIEVARGYLGTPFHLHGRVKGVGIDCVGFLICVMRELGVDVPDFTDYGLYDQQDKLLEAFRFLQMPPLPAVVPGAVLAFKVRRSSHAAICNASNGLLHTDNRTGKLVELSTVPRVLSENVIGVFGLLGVRY